MCSPECLLPSLIQRMARGSLSATAAAGRVGFGRRGSRTPTIGGRLRHPRRWLRTQRTAAARPCPFAFRPSCVISRLCTRCRWVTSTTTHVSPVSGVPARLADQGIGAMTCRLRPRRSPPFRSVWLANPLADQGTRRARASSSRTSGAAGRLSVVPAGSMCCRSCLLAAVRGCCCTPLLYSCVASGRIDPTSSWQADVVSTTRSCQK